MTEIKILSVNKSDKQGIKYPVNEIELSYKGAIDDVHAGTNRQVSLIDSGHIDLFKELTGIKQINFGEFAENITISGLKKTNIIPFDKFKIGKTVLEVCQTGKPFHDKFRELGNYLMPRVGIFCRVLKPGIIKEGDTAEYIPKTFKAIVITLSDRASKGEYEDRSGPEVQNILSGFFEKNNLPYDISSKIIPDNSVMLKELILKAANDKFDVIITTGGTGIGKRDITVETVQAILNKEIPGIMEHIRVKYGSLKPNALLSRGIAGLINESLIYTLPGSVKAVNEYMSEITKTLYHLFFMMRGIDSH